MSALRLHRRAWLALPAVLAIFSGLDLACKSAAPTPSHVTLPPPRPVAAARPEGTAPTKWFLSDEEACSLPVQGQAVQVPLPSAWLTMPERYRVETCGIFDTVDRPPEGPDACFVANENITRAEREARASGGAPAGPAGAPWNGATAPKYFERINAHFCLMDNEEAMLRREIVSGIARPWKALLCVSPLSGHTASSS